MANQKIPGLLRGLLKFSSDDLKKFAEKIRDTHVLQTKKVLMHLVKHLSLILGLILLRNLKEVLQSKLVRK